MAKRIRNNRLNLEWTYAKQCWDALVVNSEIPPVPQYTIWESEEGNDEKVIGHKPIAPKRVTVGGVTVYG